MALWQIQPPGLWIGLKLEPFSAVWSCLVSADQENIKNCLNMESGWRIMYRTCAECRYQMSFRISLQFSCPDFGQFCIFVNIVITFIFALFSIFRIVFFILSWSSYFLVLRTRTWGEGKQGCSYGPGTCTQIVNAIFILILRTQTSIFLFFFLLHGCRLTYLTLSALSWCQSTH